MARWFFFPRRKKRGDRDIASRWFGGVGEVLFFAALALAGVVLLAALLTVQFAFDGENSFGYYPLVGFCLRLTAIVLMAGVGVWRVLSSVWQAGASVERRSALAARVKSKESLHAERVREYPTIPVDDDLTNSPGTRLRFRLPPIKSPDRRLLLATLICVTLCGIASVTTVLAIPEFNVDHPDLLMTGVALAVVVAAVWSVVFFLGQLMQFTMIGPTCLEIAGHPLFPGQSVAVFLTQAGRMKLRRIDLTLLCEEESVYQQGTNIRSETRVVFSRRLFERRDIIIQAGQMFQEQIEIEIPAGAMHSFESENNSIHWTLVVRGVGKRWAKFSRTFPVVICSYRLPESSSKAVPV